MISGILGACLLVLALAGCSSSDGSDGGAVSVPLEKVDGAPVKVDAAGYRKGLAAGLSSGDVANGDLVLGKDAAACVAARWIPVLGVDHLKAKQVTPDSLADPKFDYPAFGVTAAQAEKMVGAFSPCKVDTRLLLAESLVGDDPDQAKVRCLTGKVGDDLLDRVLVSALSEAQPPDDLTAEFRKLLKTCKVG